MDFNEFWKIGCFGEYHDIYSKNLAEKFYKAGQESKQAEIAAIKAKVNDALEAFNDGSFNYCQKQLEEIV